MNEQKIRSLFPRASRSFIILNGKELPEPEPQRNKKKSLERSVQGKEASLGRVTVRYCGFAVRPQDPDNFSGSTKDLTDGLRRCGLIDGDEHWRLRLICEQEQVKTFDEERIEIEITYP